MRKRAWNHASRLTGRLLVVMALLLTGASIVKATPVKTLVQDTLYMADGSAAQGNLTIRWNAFTTSAGEAVAAGEMTVSTGANGALSIPLIPNAGATPVGGYYKVVIKLSDELKAHMRWIVGNGNEGKIQELETRIQKHEAALQRTAGLGVAAGILLTVMHLALYSIRTIHH